MTPRCKYYVLTVAALAVSILPPLFATLHFFPLWVKTSAEATLSGTVCVLLLLSLIPFGKYLIQMLKSPSAPIVWGLFTVLMFVMKSIAAQMFVVGVVGTAANLVGAILFKARKRYKEEG